MAFFYLANFTITSPTPAAELAFPATIKWFRQSFKHSKISLVSPNSR